MPLLESTAFQGGSIQRVCASLSFAPKLSWNIHSQGYSLKASAMSRSSRSTNPPASLRQPDRLDIEKRGRQSRLARSVFEISERAGVLLIGCGAGEMDMAASGNLL